MQLSRVIMDEQMVLAGSAGTTPQSLFERTHRGISLVLLIDTVLISLVLSSFLVAPYSTYLLISGVICGLIVWSGYRNRQPWAYHLATLILGVALLIFIALSVAYILLGAATAILFAFIFGWAAWGPFRRLRIQMVPFYRMSYHGRIDFGIDHEPMDEDEMLASCPSCMAILAIRPLMLSAKDRCPHCDGKLVTEETLRQLGIEEE